MIFAPESRALRRLPLARVAFFDIRILCYMPSRFYVLCLRGFRVNSSFARFHTLPIAHHTVDGNF